MNFDWDSRKAASNEEKHGVTFEEARTVFDNPLAVIFDDETHSAEEARELIIGHSQRNRILIISFVERSEAIRIISARPATGKERRNYEETLL